MKKVKKVRMMQYQDEIRAGLLEFVTNAAHPGCTSIMSFMVLVVL